ncbi:alpha/beta fold hydrolase [Acinetobacter larvae]|uniref:Alpha/beta hydrolase n=1 Tax=Acinetobacter larvae TaxID=1789224 RepID=A0A1B2LZN9_9GAMM|nr:alpha/beta fold hydrolase [Acinetobacter larvae]AOA58410.1 alpha/beta hydrolase [Acinetobacter larvae]
MILNYELVRSEHACSDTPIVLIHGLFGSLSNLGVIARALQAQYHTIQVDVRNHGLSAHDAAMNYRLMAQDILETLTHLNIDKFSAIGHSMGGKIAMQLAALAGERLEKLVVLDMAPYAYTENHHDQIFKGLFAVQQQQPHDRKQANHIMAEYIAEPMVCQFLLKSFDRQNGRWLFNLDALYANYSQILAWQENTAWTKTALFLRGENSDYLAATTQASLYAQFPQAQLYCIANAGHWLHAEQPQLVLQYILDYLNAA